MDTSVYIRRVLRDDEENREKAQRLETAIMEAEAIGDFTQLNKLAAFEARTMTTKGFVFKDIFELLDGQLPTMAGALSFKYRVELCAYLGFLKKEYDSLMEQAPSEWRDKKFKQLMCKKKEVELLLSGETELVSTINQESLKNSIEPKQRHDNLKKAMLAVCGLYGKKPPFEELWKFFLDDKDETGIIADFTDTHLSWRDTKGKIIDTQKESVANRLSRINYP